MSRRCRRPRELFGFDSFLDIVANVVGIIIRLILVAWVGARSYKAVLPLLPERVPNAVAPVTAAPTPNWEPPTGPAPLQLALSTDGLELARAQEKLLDQLRKLQEAQQAADQTEKDMAALLPERGKLEERSAALDRAVVSLGQPAQTAAATLAELRLRQQKVAEEIRALKLAPSTKKAFRYHAPISKPAEAEEVAFECSEGRVTFIEVPTMEAEIRTKLDEKGQQLRTSWKVTDVTRPAGAFRLRYTVERVRGAYDNGSSTPSGESNYAYGLTSWQVEPVLPIRGESLEQALSPGSMFRRIVAALDGQPTVATFWVYPDSFELFRKLRDYLYERGITVAGRPLKPGSPIGASIHGSRSRGQ